MNKRALNNAAWIVGCRVVQAFLGFLISMFTARFLGPGKFGLINYAASIVAFVAPIMKLGLDAILVQELINTPEKDGEILGTALIMNFVSSIICALGVISFAYYTNPGEVDTVIVCALYSLMLIAQAVEMIQFWFQAKLLSKYTSIVSLIAYLLVSIYKTFLLVTQKSVYWFAVSNAIDYFVIGVVLLYIYKRIGGNRLSFSKSLCQHMFTKGKYYIISGLMVTVFAQTDRIMLKMMLGETMVGFYSAAITCAGMTSFVFSAIIASMRPLIFEGKKENNRIYEHRTKQLYAIVVYFALCQSIVVALLAEPIVSVIYGQQYYQSISILRIIVWYTAFSYYGGAKDIWILAENKQKYLIWLNLSGAVVNVGLNYMLIPIWGANGAALASLLTQIFTNIIMGFIIQPLRYNNVLLLKSINPKYVIEFLTHLKKIKARKA